MSLSTLADQVGACAAALRPLHALIEAHVLSAKRLHGDDTTAHSAGPIRRPPCSTPRATGRANIPNAICPARSCNLAS